MKLLSRILNRIAFIRVEYVSDGSCRTEVFTWQSGGIIPAERSAAKNALTAVIACGHGVVTKSDGSQITARVKADPETFLWSSSGGMISFIRRERLGALTEELSAEGIVPVRIFCADAGADFSEMAGTFARQLFDDQHWKSLLRLVPESSAVLQALVRRMALPVLGVFLCLLVANAVFFPRVNARRQVLQTAIDARERSASTAASVGAGQRELLAEFAVSSGTPRAVLCDRIAGVVPERVVLTQLAVEPLTKRFEARKPLQRLEGRVVVSGTAPAVSDVSAFVQQLSELARCRDVRLTHVEKERDGDRLTFRIETTL